MQNVLLAVGISFLWAAQPAQTTPSGFSYRGRVVDAAGRGIAGASVWAKGTHSATTTNPDGLFLLPMPAGSYTLLVDYPGHLARETTVTQHTDSLVTITLYSTQPRATRRR